MEKVYDLHQHTHYVAMHIGSTYLTITTLSTSDRNFYSIFNEEVCLPCLISYNTQRTDVTGFGWDDEKIGEDDIVIYGFFDWLYDLFKRDKETWDEDDKFLMTAVSDYLSLAIKYNMEHQHLKIEALDLLHYAFVVPSEWEEEIRDDIIRPIFVQSGLISKQDHRDRLLFFTDIEAICYRHYHCFKRGQNTILCRVTPEGEIIIKFDLIQTATTLFNIPDAKLFPKVMKSNSLNITYHDIEERIKDFLRGNLFSNDTKHNHGIRELVKSKLVPSDQEQIIDAIIEGIYSDEFPTMDNENEEEDEEEHWISLNEEWMLSESQKDFINSLCPSIICAEIGTFLLGYMNDIVSNNFTKSYKFFLVVNDRSGEYCLPKNTITWIEYILEYNRRSLNSTVTITTINPRGIRIKPKFILDGTGIGVFEAVQYSDMYCKPRIVSSVDLSASSSVFLNSKPDAIINLDISLKSTLLTCSILDEDGLIQQIFDHNYFIEDKHLPPLGHFYSFSDTTALNVTERFIPFSERYLLGDLIDLIADDGVSIKNNIFLEIKSILTEDRSESEVLVSITQQKYIKPFMLMYLIYIKEDILCNLPGQLVSDKMDMKIGYDFSIEAMLLNNTMENKDDFKDIIYASGLVSKGDHSKKLRITTQGERIFPAIQKFLKLELSLKSYFVLCQIHEDYLQLSLHQVVTSSSPEEKEQESIIVQNEILAIQNIYDSLCSNMWYSLLQNSNLIELCEIHNTSDNNKVLDLLSSEIKTEFFTNLKRHISDHVLRNNPDMQSISAIKLNSSCNCKVRLTTSDIIDISFTPVLQDIACTLYASLLNKELFGNYMNIDYLFSFICFNHNPQLQYAFTKILEEEADDFNLELGIDTSCLVVPELFSQLLQPVIAHQPFCYKDFKIGALQQISSENYVFHLYDRGEGTLLYRSRITDTKTTACDLTIGFPFLNKGEIINNARLNRKFYLNKKDSVFADFEMALYKFKTMNYLEDNERLSRDDNTYEFISRSKMGFGSIFEEKNVDIPVVVSIKYVSYTSSLQFFLKIIGTDREDKYTWVVLNIGEPLTLTRF